MGGHQITVADPVQPLQFPDGRRPGPVPTERGEIMQPQQRSRPESHRVDIQRTRPWRDEPGVPRVHAIRCQRESVFIVAAQCRKSGIESRRRPDDVPNPDVGRKESGEPANQCRKFRFVAPLFPGPIASGVGMPDGVSRDVDVSDLADGVHTGVGASGGEQSQRSTKHRRECGIENSRYGAKTVLYRPPVEIRTVVGDIEPESHRPGVRTCRQTRPAPQRPRPSGNRRWPHLRPRPRRPGSHRPGSHRCQPPGRRPSWRPWWPPDAPCRPPM